MSVSILWAAFDDFEVERVWSQIPVGELLISLPGDEYFLSRLKEGVPKEKALAAHSRFYPDQLEAVKKIVQSFGKEATLKESAPEAARANLLTYEELLLLDDRFVFYFTYDIYAERLDNWCTAADSLLYGRKGGCTSMDVFISDQFRSRIKSATFDSLKTALRTTFSKNERIGAYRDPFAKPDEDVEYFLENFGYLTELFDFAEIKSLEIYVETSMESNFSDFGAGRHNLVTRFDRRFDNVNFPSEWKIFEVSEWKFRLMQKVGKDTSKYKIKPSEPQQPKATGLLNRINNLLRRKQ